MKLFCSFVLLTILACVKVSGQSTPSYASSGIATDSGRANSRDGVANFSGSRADTRDGVANFGGSRADARDGVANFGGSRADARDGVTSFSDSLADTRDGVSNFSRSHTDSRNGKVQHNSSLADSRDGSIGSASYAFSSSESKILRSQTTQTTTALKSNLPYVPAGNIVPARSLNKDVIGKAVSAVNTFRESDGFQCSEFVVTTAIAGAKVYKLGKAITTLSTLDRALKASSAAKTVADAVIDVKGMKACYSVIKNR